MAGLERTVRVLRGEPVCGFDWPGAWGWSRKACDGVPVGERDGKPACSAHLKPYVPTENKPYDDEGCD